MNQSNSCTQSQQLLGTESKLMRIASDSLMPGFSSPNTFTFHNMSPIPVILPGAEGEIAESILLESTLSQGVWDDHFQSPFSFEGEGSLRWKKYFLEEREGS